MLCLGLDFKRGGFVDRAVEAFKEVRRLDPSNTYALLHLEKVYEEQHQWDDAARIRQELVALDGPEPPARSQAILAFLENERGLAALKAGDLAAAQARFRAALDLDALVTPASVNLGDALERQGQRDEAVRLWEGAGRVHARARPPGARAAAPRLHRPRASPDRFLDLCRRLVAVAHRRTGAPAWPSGGALADAAIIRAGARSAPRGARATTRTASRCTKRSGIAAAHRPRPRPRSSATCGTPRTPCSSSTRTSACAATTAAPSCSGSARTATSGTASSRSGSRRSKEPRGALRFAALLASQRGQGPAWRAVSSRGRR